MHTMGVPNPRPRPRLRPKTFRSESYKQFIRKQPCLNCGAQGNHAHHEGLGNRGIAIKPPDTQTVPLCPDCHALRHQKGADSFWQKRDVKLAIIGYLTLYLQGQSNVK